ncbi:MAG TPA: YceI family protein [Gemmatimonadaceae bacterium]|jgi:polyisoprenoid-binding protein YceI
MTTNTAAETTTWTVDPTHAEVGFAVKHLMISTVRGRFGAVEGTVVLNEADPSKSSVDVSVDIASVDTRQEMRDNHLRSPDFFDVENHPKMHFVSKKIVGDLTDDFKVIGDLTIRGKSQEVTLDVSLTGRGNDPWGNERMGFEAKGKVNRLDFGLHYNPALETGGFVVGDEVKISIDVELIKQKAA